MNNLPLSGKRIAVLAMEGFEQSELQKPRQALLDAGADAPVISPKAGQIRGWNMTDWGDSVQIDLTLDQANPDDFDALLLPGGAMNADHLRMEAKAVDFVRAFVTANKPMAVICHAPWMLVEADAVRGKTLTSWPSLKTDITNAGGNWVDQQVVVDDGLVTSRKPDDIPAFNQKMIEEFSEEAHLAEGRAEAGSTISHR